MITANNTAKILFLLFILFFLSLTFWRQQKSSRPLGRSIHLRVKKAQTKKPVLPAERLTISSFRQVFRLWGLLLFTPSQQICQWHFVKSISHYGSGGCAGLTPASLLILAEPKQYISIYIQHIIEFLRKQQKRRKNRLLNVSQLLFNRPSTLPSRLFAHAYGFPLHQKFPARALRILPQ